MIGGVFSPNVPALEALLGSKIDIRKHGVKVRPTGGGAFGSGYGGLSSAIADLTGPLSLYQPEQLARKLDFAGPLESGLQTYKGLGDLVNELIGTGLKTDISPYARKAERDFRETYMPMLAERGLPRMSSMASLGAREASRIPIELQVAAMNLNDPVRRVGMLPTLLQMGTGQAMFPGAVVSDLLGAGARLRGLDQQPSQRLFDVFSALSGIPVQGQFSVGQDETSSESFQNYAAGISNLLNTPAGQNIASTLGGGLSSLGKGLMGPLGGAGGWLSGLPLI
jgi:hypothetical protein